MLRGKLIYILIFVSFFSFGQQRSKMLQASVQQVNNATPTELYTEANVLSLNNEANSVTGMSRAATTITTPVVESTIVHDGSYSAKFTLNTTSTTSFGTVTLTFDGDGTYDFSFWLYSTDGSQRIRQITNTDQGELILTQTTNTWEQFTVTFTVTGGATTGTFEIGRGAAGADFYIDAFSLTKQ